MAKGFDQLRASSTDMTDIRVRMGVTSPDISLAGDLPHGTEPPNAEKAARDFLRMLTTSDERRSFRTFGLGPDAVADASAPQFVKRDERRQEVTKTEIVTFEQVKNEIPVFGSRAVVEMDDRREFVSASIDVAEVEDVDTEATVSADQARRDLAALLGVDAPGQLPEPEKTILPHPREEGALHLAWHFRQVPIEPPADTDNAPDDDKESACLGGCTAHNILLEPSFDYFVDAHSGELIYLFPNSAHLDIPTRCQGQDENGETQLFYGRVNGGSFEMENPFEDIRTLDMGLNAIETTPPPANAVQNGTNNWQNTNPAAVSAHVNATRVLDFLFRILRRNSIDDKGMTLENIVNCYSNQALNPPEWINAVWWKGSMWYGQESQPGGNFRSLSRFLDVIGHELFHGVTEHTAELVYESLPGALNESFSDIFGVIIQNWHLAPLPGDVSTWTWEIGPGLGASGDPLRDMANPGSVGRWRRPRASGQGYNIVIGLPDHMNQYVILPVNRTYDWGGVHWYSNIHNLAAHNVLTSQRADGSRVFTPEEVAILYYIVLTRLTRLSDFDDARSELLAVSATVHAGNPPRVTETQQAITQAYDDVGIV